MDGLNTQSEAATPFPLTRLPIEVQLLILRHILVSPAPIINPSVPLCAQNYLVRGEEKGQHQINPGMIFTSKLFYVEGLRLLYSQNEFMYTEHWTAFSYTLSRCDVEECKRCPRSNPLDFYPFPEHPQGSPCNWNLAFQAHAANIHLRLPGIDDSGLIRVCEELLEILDRFTNLRTFHLDFLDMASQYEDIWDADDDEDEYLMDGLRDPFWKTMKKLEDPALPVGALSEIVLTGLPQSDLSLFVVKEEHHNEVPKRDHLELVWMGIEEVDKWIAKEHATASRWLFSRPMPDWHVVLSASHPPLKQTPTASDPNYRDDVETLGNVDDLLSHW